MLDTPYRGLVAYDGRLQSFARAESTLSEDALWGSVMVGGSVGF